MGSSYPTLDGFAQSWADIVVTASPYGGGQINVEDISDISCERTVETGEQRKTGGDLVATTVGSAKYTAKSTFYASGYEALLDELAKQAIAMGRVTAGGEAQVSLVRFDILIQHTVIGTTDIRKKEIMGCRIIKDAFSGSEGNDPDKLEIDLHPMRIVYTVKGKRIVLL